MVIFLENQAHYNIESRFKLYNLIYQQEMLRNRKGKCLNSLKSCNTSTGRRLKSIAQFAANYRETIVINVKRTFNLVCFAKKNSM